MGRLKQKGKAGAARAYITRTAAVKKLQVSLADFRRLCILKGIYPRQPRSVKKANKGNSAPTSFYYTKDIQYLAHEPILRKLREHKAFAKKISRALGRGEWVIAKGLEERRPGWKLDHVIKERYPTFLDALRDIDDALCLIALFSHLPSNERVSPQLVENCTRLYNEWQLYVMKTKSLKKVFLSIKGVYYQAVVQGETINWIEPWMFTQTIPTDVDTRILLTFLELYQTLLGFVFFKLYTDEGWAYPPALDTTLDERGLGIGALQITERGATKTPVPASESGGGVKVTKKDVNQAIKEISSAVPSTKSITSLPATTAEPMEVEDEEFVPQPSSTDPTAQTTALPTYQSIAATSSSNTTNKLFEGLNIWLSRETPRGMLEFVIRSFGGKVGWQGDGGEPETWEGWTHVVIDRPPVAPASSIPSQPSTTTAAAADDRRRKYVQPQWVIDSLNAGRLLNEERYARGKVLPPHLSPFGEGGGYDPAKYAELERDVEMKEQEDQEGGSNGDDDDDEESEEEIIEGADMPDEEEEDSDEEMEQPKSKPAKPEVKPRDKTLKKAKSKLKSADAETLRAAELEAEAAGMDFAEFEKAVKMAKKKSKSAEAKATEGREDAEKEMNKMMMSNKQRKLYEKMKFGERKREAEKNRLEERRKEIEKTKRKEARKAGRA